MSRTLLAGHHRIAEFYDCIAGGTGNGLLQHSGFDILYGSAVCRSDLVHNMRLIIIAPVDQGAKACDHLDHGSIKALSEGIGRQFRYSERIFIIDHGHCARLTRQINVCLQSEAKEMLIINKLIFS